MSKSRDIADSAATINFIDTVTSNVQDQIDNLDPVPTNIAGGSAGTIPYQSAADTTAMLAVGTAGQVLQTNGAAAPSWATISAGVGDHEIIVNTGGGFGSTNTRIRRFTTIESSVGTDITYADSATLGASFTINTTGIYAMSYTERLNSANYVGISVNSTELSTEINSITNVNRLTLFNNGESMQAVTGSTVAKLTAGDVVRPHTGQQGTYNASFAQVFRIRKIGTI
jgi:hypothetical protein